MRPQPLLRARRPMAVGAVGFATLAAGASAAAQAPNSQDAITVGREHTHVLAGHTARVRGALRPARQGAFVALEARRRGHWRTLDTAPTDVAGHFALRYRSGRIGSWPLRVRLAGAGADPTVRPRVRRLNVFRHAYASWYGPGLYGGHLACGGTLTPGTLGVANKSLPCGAKVTLRYRG